MAGDRNANSEASNTSRATKTSKGSKASTRSQSHGRSDSKQRHSRTADSKAIHETVGVVRRKVKAFKKEHLGGKSKYDFAACSKCLNENILPVWGIPEERLTDHEEFLQLTLRKEVDEEVASSDEYIDLIGIAKRAHEFDMLVPDAKRRLFTCLEKHAVKSCTSLKEMAGNSLLLAVSEYDSKVTQYKADIEAKGTELEENYSSYKQMLKPFPQFVSQGAEHASKINVTCNNLLEICMLMENWVKDDDEYPDKLMEEVESNKKLKENLKESMAAVQAQKEENQGEKEKLVKQEKKSLKGYNEHRKEKDRLKSRKAELEDRKRMQENRIEKKREEREDLKKEREAGPMSPRQSDDFLQRLEAIEKSLERMEKDRKTTDKQLRRVEKDLKPATDRTYEHKVGEVEAVTHRHHREEKDKEDDNLDDEMTSLRERMAKVDSCNDTLLKIREMKLSSEAMRKILREKKQQERSQSSGRQNLSEACDFAAPAVGNAWPKLYTELPFDPARDLEKRQRDIVVMDGIFARNDVTVEEQAKKSLGKWQAFNRHGNVHELVDGLKKIKKTKVAHDVQQKFL